MSRYSIWVLEEDSISFPDGGQLDGITQGDGSHLVGQTIRFEAGNWQEIPISDRGSDVRFADNDSDQRLDGDVTLNGTEYGAGDRVEAEYAITLTDGTDTWEAIAFNVNDSQVSYATIEGLAFVGGPGGFPPVGVDLRVVSAQEGPNIAAADYATPLCFVRGTLIETRSGPCPVERLRPGMQVRTLDAGLATLRWRGGRIGPGHGPAAPVEVPGGAGFGPLRLSPAHKLLLAGPAAELLTGEGEVLASAAQCARAGAGRRRPVARVEYHHLLFDRHEIVWANGRAAESLRPGSADARAFDPGLAGRRPAPAARRMLRGHEAALLFATARPDFPTFS